MQERVRELEWRYRKYLKKRFLRGIFLGILCLGLGFGSYRGLEFYAHQKDLNAKFLEEKKRLQTKITEAKIKQEKMRLHQERLEQRVQDLTPEQHPPARVVIESNVFNAPSLKRSYYQNPSFEKALMLSRLYLENKDYEKSIFWSLRANEWDRGAKESWLLFARARAELTKGDEEAEILRLYAHYYESVEPSQ